MSSSSPSPSGSESGSFAEPMKRSPNVGTTTYNTGTQGDRAPMTNIGGFISPGKGEEYENYGERESEARRLMYSPFSMGHMGILNGGRGSSPFVDFCATSLSPLHAPLFSPAPPNANLSLFTSYILHIYIYYSLHISTSTFKFKLGIWIYYVDEFIYNS